LWKNFLIMEFEWDENKNQSNFEKHKINFTKASKVFEDDDKIIYESNQPSEEKRFVVLGEIMNLLYSVIYTLRKSVIRIISARRANENEREIYYSRKEKE